MARLIRKALLAFAALMLTAAGMQAQEMLNNVPAQLVGYPELIIYNAKIMTMNDKTLSSDVGQQVQAMAVRGDRILATGTTDEVMKLAGPQTKKLDLKGRTVVPGLINTHSHMHDHSIQLWSRTHPQEVEKVTKRFSVNGKDYAELTKGIELVVKEQMAHPLPGQWAWIDLPSGGASGTGIGVQYLLKNQMDRSQLDKLAPNLPVFVLSHPNFLLNTAARNAFLNLYEVPLNDENEKIALTQDTTIQRSLVVDQYFREHLDVLADVLEDGLKHEAAAGFTTFSSHIVGLRIQDG